MIESEIANMALLHSYNPDISTPDDFIKLFSKYGKTTYRSTNHILFDKFKPFKYFIILFVETGSNGKVTAWGLAEVDKCLRVKKREHNSFFNANYGLKGDSESKFRSLFYFIAINNFKKNHNYQEFNLIKTGQPLNTTQALRSAIYVDLPSNILNEITSEITTL